MTPFNLLPRIVYHFENLTEANTIQNIFQYRTFFYFFITSYGYNLIDTI